LPRLQLVAHYGDAYSRLLAYGVLSDYVDVRMGRRSGISPEPLTRDEIKILGRILWIAGLDYVHGCRVVVVNVLGGLPDSVVAEIECIAMLLAFLADQAPREYVRRKAETLLFALDPEVHRFLHDPPTMKMNRPDRFRPESFPDSTEQ